MPDLCIFIFLQVRAQVCALFIFVKWQKLWSFPAAHLGATAWPSLCCSWGKKGTSRDNQRGVIQEPWGWRFSPTESIFLSVAFLTMNTKCTGNGSMWLFLHVWFCSAPTKDFCLIPHLSRFLVSSTLQPSWTRDIPKAHCSIPYVKCLPCTTFKEENSGFKVSHKVLQYYSMMHLTWCKMKSSFLSRCKMRALLFLVNCARCKLWNYK